MLQLEQIGSGYASRERFLTELTLDPPDATSDQAGPPHRDEDYLILSTIHSAKGQEWKNVFVLNTVDGCIPADLGVGTKEDIEEERRLLYVAMTRAKDSLNLVMVGAGNDLRGDAARLGDAEAGGVGLVGNDADDLGGEGRVAGRGDQRGHAASLFAVAPRSTPRRSSRKSRTACLLSWNALAPIAGTDWLLAVQMRTTFSRASMMA